ncbi:MAG: hypothetical protein QW275_00305 [Candidatus Anstonellaceae archaeon]
MTYCLTCGAQIDEYDSAYYARSMLCIPCYIKKSAEGAYVLCSKCALRVKQEEARQRRGRLYCSYCFSELERVDQLPSCYICTKKIENHQKSLKLSNGQYVHSECAKRNQNIPLSTYCSVCGKETSHFKILPNSKAICPRCNRSNMGSASKSATSLPSILVRVVRRLMQ